MPDSPVRVRPASPDDFPAIERIAVANEEPTTAPGWPGWLYLEHLQRDQTLVVAERDGLVVGYGGAAVVGGARPAAHVTDLFVDPVAHGRGAGGAILRTLIATVSAEDWSTCSSSEPRAMTLYARAGLQPRWPVCYLEGAVATPAVEADPDAATRRIEPDEAAAIEFGWSGRDLAVHYRNWASRPPTGTAFRLEIGGRTAAVGTARDGRMGPGRVLDHLAIAPWADPVRVMLAAVASEAVRGGFADSAPGAVDPAISLKLALAGPHPALPALLARDFVIADHDTWCATRPDLVDPLRLVIDPSFG